MECVYNADGIRYESKHKENNKSELDKNKNVQQKNTHYPVHNYNILKKESNIDEIKKLLLNYSC